MKRILAKALDMQNDTAKLSPCYSSLFYMLPCFIQMQVSPPGTLHKNEEVPNGAKPPLQSRPREVDAAAFQERLRKIFTTPTLERIELDTPPTFPEIKAPKVQNSGPH
jgi:hypothetical protein